MKNSAGPNRTVRFFQIEQNRENRELSLQALIDLSPPFSLSTKKRRGGFQNASLVIIFVFILAFIFSFIFMGLSWRRGIKRRRVRVRGTDTTIKAVGEATKAHVSIPLLHGFLRVKMSHPLFKRFNIGAFFSLRSNRRARGLQVQVGSNLLH
jgi:hypothetical protein